MNRLILISVTAAMFAVYGFFNIKTVPSPVALEHLMTQTKAAEQKMMCGPLTTQEVVDLAIAFKATLTAAQITTTQLSYTLTNAKVWSNLPVTMVPRIGIRFGDLNGTQLAAAKALIRAASGGAANEGYEELQQLWAADDYLLANGGGSAYGAGQYYLAFLGTPAMTGTWELQMGGHHVAVANTYKDGVLIGATPSFRGVEPFAAFTSGANSYEPLRQERDAFAAMLNGLTTAQATTARLSSTFSDILLGPGKDWQFPTTRQGLQCNTLTTAQKALVIAAIKTYTDDIDTANARVILAKYTAELDQTYIAYAGNTSLTVQNDYVRIDGPSLWLEYNTQGGIIFRNVPHPHSIWRDRTSDYGGTGNTTGIATPTVITSVKQYPNPANEQTTLEISLKTNADISVMLYDVAGKLVAEPYRNTLIAGTQTVSFNVASLPKGTYFYQIQTTENGVVKTISKQMVKL